MCKMRQKRWIYRNESYDNEHIIKVAGELGLSPVVLTVLYNRGVSSPEAIRAFLAKSMQTVHDPMQLPDMDKAVQRIYDAVCSGEKIYIYGDYDADGVTSTVIMYKYLISHGADVHYYIPDRVDEGYGINIMAVNRISKTGCKLLITVDCGITAFGETQLAKAQGMDVIITDHHTCKEKLPDAYAVINPKRHDSFYPFRELAGAGVAFKTVLALSIKFGEKTKDIFYKFAPYAAIGTVADVVTLQDENRVIVDRGLSELSKTTQPGICALVSASGIKETNTGAIAFGIAPRLNAAGRLDSADVAVELFMCENKARAKEIAELLNEENAQRREQELKIFKQACEMIESSEKLLSDKVLVVSGENWHHGVIGIVASRICERYYKPVVVISCDGESGKGSCRSLEGFNIFEALSSCEDVLEKFGGHAMAAGLSLAVSDIGELSDRLNKYAAEHMTDEMTVPSLKIDCKISPKALTAENIKYLDILEPCGTGNEKPVFSIIGAEVVTCMYVGEAKSHLRLQIKKGGTVLSCIAFRMGEMYDYLKPGTFVAAAFCAEINTYNGMRSVQLRILDIKILK